MFILIFFIVFSILQWTTNKVLNISDENAISYSYSTRDGLIIFGLLVAGIGLQFIPFKGKIFWMACGSYSLAIALTMLVLATIKKVVVEKQREELQKIFDVLTPILPKNSELDMNNPPFKLGYEKNQVNRITIEINPNTFKEAVAVNICLSLNRFLPTYEWVNEFDFAARECAFVGTPLPPHIARYVGSWLRPAEIIPIGLSGLGEVFWCINSTKYAGRSLYVYEDGKKAKSVDSPSAPQALCVGGPLGLDTIIPTTKGYKTMGTIEVGDEVFDINNQPVKVLGKSEVFVDHDIYHLRFASGDANVIDIISDTIHRFPVETTTRVVKDNSVTINQSWTEKTVQDLTPFTDKIIGRDPRVVGLWKSYALTIKEQVDTQPVQCILVDSDSHLFLITDEKNDNWNGGQSYPYKAIYTRNTGGGKAIYVNQEVEVDD